MSPDHVRLSVLDLVPVRTDQTTVDALAASVSLARVADEPGYHRYWVAEHHNMPAVAATNPPVLIAMLAGATARIRVGSGGVMLPNHAPLVVAEQFALLEAAHPGRIDLGIGRAPGTDPVTSWALRARRRRRGRRRSNRFPEYVDDVMAMMDPAGLPLDLQGRPYLLHATPVGHVARRRCGCSARRTTPPGSPPSSGCPTSSPTTSRGRAPPRRSSCTARPSSRARTRRSRDLPHRQRRRRPDRRGGAAAGAPSGARDGGAAHAAAPLQPQLTVEEAAEVSLPPEHEDLARAMRERWVIGSPETARAQIDELAERFAVDEVMVHPVAGSSAGSDRRRSPAREATLELLAGAAVPR